AIPSRAEIAAVRAAPAVLLIHRGRGRQEPAGVVFRNSGAERSEEPGIHIRQAVVMDFGLAALAVIRSDIGRIFYDLRAAYLFVHSEPPAEAAQEVRGPHAQDLGEARHPPGGLLDSLCRRRQQRSALPAGV